MISIVTPVYNEARRLPVLLARLLMEAELSDFTVVDAGSTDDTPSIATGASVTIIPSGWGRGIPLAAGAELATEDIVLFLNANLLSPIGGLSAITTDMTDPKIAGGNFCLYFDVDSGFSRWLTGF
ncbi:MAG: glycosyltransferase [Rhodospirillaceae bacterium]|jgi:glycosyltransferase involved in cell wall biosynthesis